MTYDTVYDWMWWLSAASILGGLYGFVLLAAAVLHDLWRAATRLVHLGQPLAADASSHHRKGS